MRSMFVCNYMQQPQLAMEFRAWKLKKSQAAGRHSRDIESATEFPPFSVFKTQRPKTASRQRRSGAQVETDENKILLWLSGRGESIGSFDKEDGHCSRNPSSLTQARASQCYHQVGSTITRFTVAKGSGRGKFIRRQMVVAFTTRANVDWWRAPPGAIVFSILACR